MEFSVEDVQVHGGYVIHVGKLEGTLKVGDKVKCNIDEVIHCYARVRLNHVFFYDLLD